MERKIRIMTNGRNEDDTWRHILAQYKHFLAFQALLFALFRQSSYNDFFGDIVSGGLIDRIEGGIKCPIGPVNSESVMHFLLNLATSHWTSGLLCC